MPSLREYKQQRPIRGSYDTITFYHPSFGYVRLVDKQFFDKTLAGQVYKPARFEIEESQQSGTPVIDATVKLGRLSSDIKTLMKKWKGVSRLSPITATRQIFDSGDTSAPMKNWTLFVKTVDVDSDAASVTLSITNPLNNNIGRLYDPVEYTGLQYL
ncbi:MULTISPECIES: hypothetical protein [Enterobacteriaceae]|uniref:hypothetical protein n=1 Tax=Enterobacteriaceae TaxID=543 RepID=UPI00188B2ABC|nr:MULTISPECIES: hypothetical protein [Enterobacteriaceae]MBF4156809.1 hypothetical protein [Enterobacter cloacae]MBL7388930.1 hypothetical protein [Escherichia coli]MBY5117955.1 hypothetical protein [Enterobacter cloacae]UWH33485.1 hypothetical protein KYX58_04945 [Escherichia coli]UWH38148.1 hypothetical protein KX927_05580 [Escherichia coli]